MSAPAGPLNIATQAGYEAWALLPTADRYRLLKDLWRDLNERYPTPDQQRALIDGNDPDSVLFTKLAPGGREHLRNLAERKMR